MNNPNYKGIELLPLSVIEAARAGDAEAVEEGISLRGALGGGGFWLGPVLHGDQEHIPDALSLQGDEPLALRQLFAGLNGVVQGIAEEGAQVQGVQEIGPVQV